MADTTYAQQVGASVRAELARRRIPQVQVATVIGLSQGAVSARLAGTVALDVEELRQIADFLGVQPSELMPEGAR